MVAMVLIAAGPAWAADEDPPSWGVTVTPYLWAAGLYGDVTVAGTPATLDASFIDILDSTDSLIGLQGHLAVTRGRVGAFGDLTYLKLKVEDAGATGLDVENRIWLVEFGLQYRVLDTISSAEGKGVAIDAYGGGRYTSLELDLDTQGAPSANASQSWVDPMIGLRATFQLSEHFLIVVGGDVGGFGVGSDFAWSALGLLGYQWKGLGLDWAVLAGYRALGQDYSTGSGRQRFQWDTVIRGPIVGLSIRF
jgi:hypothetical protein